MNNIRYSKNMKLAQLIAADSELLSLLQRLDIKLGFGEATVEDICRRYGLSTELFVIICNIYSFRDYRPDADTLTSDDITHITNYLQASHNYYKQVCFPAIHDKIHSLVVELDDVSRHLIDKFYDDYDCEVANHFRYEETIVFPYIASLVAGTLAHDSEYSISKFEKSHSYIGEKLNDLKNIIIKYLPEEHSSPLRFEILKDIYDLENDLRKHSLIENRLLVSLVEKLEKSNE
ncbi:MAG: hemerythrin domain-containing protein [Bacteroidaceae bacterium]|nr:hemerythrin domain-containing protein [Bacteroidaceae bacterium]